MVFRSRTVVVLMILALIIGVVISQAADGWISTMNPTSPGEDQVKVEKLNPSKSLWEESGLTEDQLNKIASTYYLIDQKFYQDTESNQLIDGAIHGMLSVLEDPYTVYMDEE